MRALWIGLTLSVAALSSPAVAQLPQVRQGFAPDQGAQITAPPTKFERLNQSLEQLLNAGYQIRTTAMGTLILAKLASGDKASWVMCSFEVAMGIIDGTPGHYRPPSSACFALN